MSIIFPSNAIDLTETLRRNARKQLDSYADEWILFRELVQNALDAVENNQGEKRVRLVLDPANNEITVHDNGESGFPADESLFTLGNGTKGDLNDPNIRGEHGVGLKMVVICSEKFDVWSRNEGTGWNGSFSDGFRFLESGESANFNHGVEDLPVPDGFTTTARVRFPRNHQGQLREIDCRKVLCDLFDEYEDRQPIQALTTRPRLNLIVEHYLRTTAYTGDVNRLFDDREPATIEVDILNDTALGAEDLAATYPDFVLEHWRNPQTIQVKAKYWDPTEWFEEPVRRGYRLKDTLTNVNPGVPTPNGLWVLKLNQLSEFRSLLINPTLHERDIAVFDEFLTEHVAGVFAVIGSGARNRTYPISRVMLADTQQQIAADGIITTNAIKAPKKGKNQNYLNNIHVVINIRDRVNYGKQGLKNPWVLKRLHEFFEEAYIGKFVDLAKSIAGNTPTPPPDPPAVSTMGLADLGDPRLTIKKAPDQEQTLIAITHELMSKGLLTGIETYRLSSFDIYDGHAHLARTNQFEPTRDDDLELIEYKLRMMDLIRDFELNNKSIEHLDLAIVWENDLPRANPAYEIHDLDVSTYERISISPEPAVMREVATGHECLVIEIKELITA